MTRTEFFLQNLIDVFSANAVTLSYGMLEDASFDEILAYIPDISESEKIELFNNAVDMLEGRTILKLLSSNDAGMIARVDIGALQANFQLFRELASSLFSESTELKDYKVNYRALSDLKESLTVIQGGKA